MIKIIFKYENQVKEVEFQQNNKIKFSLKTSTLDNYSYENNNSYNKLLVIKNLEASNLILEKLVDNIDSLKDIQTFEVYIDGSLIKKGTISKESIEYRFGTDEVSENTYVISEVLTCLVN